MPLRKSRWHYGIPISPSGSCNERPQRQRAETHHEKGPTKSQLEFWLDLIRQTGFMMRCCQWIDAVPHLLLLPSRSILCLFWVSVCGHWRCEVSCTLKWNLFCSSDTRESTWSGPCILKMCLKITGSFPTFADSVCKQVASWRTSSGNRQQVKSSWYTLRCAQQLPTIIMQHEKRRRIYLWNRWFDAMLSDAFRCRLRLRLRVRLRLMTNG